jgi:ligand-binding sensor domain-containing protein/putative methionine-R-sulfoxide reductase with GAF domain
MYSLRNILITTLYSGILSLFCPLHSFSQSHNDQASILFYQLNTSHGLSDNYIYDMCTDKGGNLWIATGEGLNMFNGKTVVKFFRQEYPQLDNDFIRQVICDDKNRIWVLTENGNIAVIDEQRRFHRVGLYNNGNLIPTRRILHTRSKGIILFTQGYHYVFTATTGLTKMDSLSVKDFSAVSIQGFDTLYKKGFKQIIPFDDDQYVFVVADGFFKVNYLTGLVEKKYAIPGITALARMTNDQLLYFDENILRLQVIGLSSGEKTNLLDNITDQNGKLFTGRVSNAKWINTKQLLLTTRKDGVYLFNTVTKQLINQRHNAADPTTLINNSPGVITIDSSGWVFVGATPNGASYFKSNAVIGQQSIFLDRSGNSYDGFINSIATRDNDTYYIGVSDNLLRWKRSTNTTEFLSNNTNALSLIKEYGANYLAFDSKGRLWVAIPGKGIHVLDENMKPLRLLAVDSMSASSLPSNFIRHMQMAGNDYMWISTRLGICRVNITNMAIDKLEYEPLKELRKTACNRVWFSDSNTVWIATDGRGAWEYSLDSKRLIQHTTANGLSGNDVFCFNKDRFNNIYIGTSTGLDILLRNGQVKTITTKDGLLNKRIEALLLDRNNRMWIGNDVGLACFSIADTSLKYFDERYGLSVQGFRINSYHQNSDDELVWGTERGVQYFYPDNLLQQKVSLPTTINRVETRDVVANLTESSFFDLLPTDNYVTFYFTSIDYSKHLRTFYEYRLEGIDEEWIRVADQNFVRYNSLPPGRYVFKVRASNDNKLWEEAVNTVTIDIAKPLWDQVWFKLLGILLVLGLIWYVINFYRKRQLEQREELETEVVINYFASRINSHQRTDDILWDVAKNCISKLNFEDCVIYLVDTERNVLVQKAAYGPKMERDFTIYKPIEIPVGKGIVGTVAQTGKAELIPNTELDERYIADDARRYSEVTVPLIIDDKVIGVIDSEHSKRNFFNQKHLNILSTVAVLCANQIQRAKSEEEKQQAKIEVLENRQKVTESRLQSLRLQMNPHFLFNALNSIQQMILANEEMVATRYLSRFSKLLRTILVHSDKESVTLKEELEILNLYVELESVRFRDSFQYSITCDEEIDKEEVKVPTLLVQPFVENAIWHGLMHKEGNRKLKIDFFEKNNCLRCVIEDNGIGREKSAQAKMNNGQRHVSKGIQVSLERLKNMENDNGQKGSLIIFDLKDDNGQPSGTRVEIDFPIQN